MFQLYRDFQDASAFPYFRDWCVGVRHSEIIYLNEGVSVCVCLSLCSRVYTCTIGICMAQYGTVEVC